MVGVVLDGQAGVLIVSLGGGGMYFRASSGLPCVRSGGLVHLIAGSRSDAIIHLDKTN